MDVDTPSTESAAPLPVETDDEQTNWKIEKAMLTTESHNINQELKDVRDRLTEIGEVNKRLSDELSVKVAQLQDQTGRQRILEAERNELTDKRLELEAENARLKIEKEELDAAAIQAGKWTQSAQLETFTLRDEVQKLTAELANFKYTKEALEKEVQTIQYEREKYNTERSLYAESKRWLMQEVSERDNKVSSLRLELSNKDIQGANERLQYNQQINLLRAQLESLTEKVDMLTFTNSDLSKRIENTELSKATEIANLEDEIRCQVDLQRVMKTSMEEAKNAADHFKDQLDAQENILAEVRRVLQEHQDDMERENIAHAEAISQKDEELAQLRAELAKASEMMKSMSDVKLNVSEEELSELAPAAADTVRYLRGGQSLSSLVLEHARVRGKLTEVESENLNLRTTLEELLETIDQSKPQLISQRLVAEELYDKNNKFEKQLDLAESERRELICQRDTAQRDLAYIRAELEKYQRDFEFVSKRNADLLYAVERQRDPNWSDEPNPQLYESIVQLQRRNVELESDIENAKTSAAQAAINAQSEEMAQLRADLAVTKKSEEELKTRVEKTKAAFDSLKERTEHFKELVRDSVTAAEARTARLRAEEAVAARLVCEATIERLKSYAEEFKADSARHEQQQEQRIQSAEANIAIVTETNIKLNAMLDAQKTNTAVMEQEYKSALKERDVALAELNKVTAADSEKERRLVDLGRQALEAAEQAGGLRVQVRALEDQLYDARTQINNLTMTASFMKESAEKEEKIRMSVVEMANFLSRVETERLVHANTQLEVLQLERDSLKASTTRLSDQLTHARNDAKLVQQRLEKELEVVRSRLVEKEEQLARDEMELTDLRSKLVVVNSQITSADTSGMTPDRMKREFLQLKTRNQYLESELDEAKSKLMESETTQKRMDSENAISASHYNVLEENLKQTEQAGALEKDRLIANTKCLEERAQQLTEYLNLRQSEIDELRTNYDELTIRNERETTELRRQLQVASANLENAKRELEIANNSLTNSRNDAARNAATLEQHSTIVRNLEERISDSESARARIQGELNSASIALVAMTTAKNEADQLKEHAERQLQKKTEELAGLEAETQRKQAENDEKLSQLTSQYTSLSSRFSDSGSAMDVGDGGSSQSGLVEPLQKLIEFLRQAKEEALTRAMNAEVEMRRLRAETSEFERGRNDLLQKIRDLETEKIATTASLVEKAHLVEQVQSLTAVHNVNAQLTEEKNKLVVQLAQTQKENAGLEKLKLMLTTKSEEQRRQIASSEQEAIQRKKEIEQLKRAQQNQKVTNLAPQLEQLKSQLNIARQELATTNERVKSAEAAKTAAEEKLKDVHTKFTQTRQLAIKYRDENTALKAGLDPSTSAAPVSSNNGDCESRLATQAKSYEEKIAELQTQIDEARKEAENASMKVLRMSVMEKTLKKTSDQLTELRQQNEKLAENNRVLTNQQQSSSSTDMESKSLGVTRAPQFRQTPTKTTDPIEPDQTVGHRSVQNPSPSAAKRSSFGRQALTTSSNVVPPAPAPPTNTPQQRISPVKQRPIPPSIPNEPIDIIPPVPSENIPVVPDPTPPTNTFGSGLPVPHMFQSSVRVPAPSLFSSSSTTTVQPQAEKRSVLPNIDSVPTTPASNPSSQVTTTSSITTGQKMFGGEITTSSSADNMLLPEESVAEGAAGQSSLVSGSIDQQKSESANAGSSDGESRDSSSMGGVSSSDARRKRAANDFEMSEAKRQRESPNEAVTSSETQQQNNQAEIPELDDDEEVLAMENEVSDEDPNDNTLNDNQDEVIDLENDEEVIEDEMEGDEDEDDDSFGNDEEYEDDRAPEEVDEDDVVVISDEDDAPENDNDAESLNDDDIEEIEIEDSNNDVMEDVLGGEDSQPSLDDQDREAASAVEEAEDEGRDPLVGLDEPSAPADPTGAGVGGNSGMQRVRLPTGIREAERDDQCSSSNETAEERPEAQLSARQASRQRPLRGAKPTRGVYRPGRGGRGGGTA
ncbi:hypothetical protein L5515_013936 [Caenorhabditis briggsae]|uniref:Nucleoprotein TPR n=1 Tax=Caenorhabditis briggsae TaxID=6238 RepID=A0AAE9EAL7_CAEBR|nr:hypothetical protein L5515_013936 [Caenorhabditis briggsae]